VLKFWKWINLSAAWPRDLKRRFYGDRVITIAWYRFNFQPHRTRCLSLLDGFEQAANSVVRRQRNNRKTRKWTTPKRMRIRPKYSATSLSRDKKIKIEQTNKLSRNFFFLFDLELTPSCGVNYRFFVKNDVISGSNFTYKGAFKRIVRKLVSNNYVR